MSMCKTNACVPGDQFVGYPCNNATTDNAAACLGLAAKICWPLATHPDYEGTVVSVLSLMLLFKNTSM
jgi:hypothetical protein